MTSTAAPTAVVDSFGCSVSVVDALTARVFFTGKVGGKVGRKTHAATLFIDVQLPPANAPVKRSISFWVHTPTGGQVDLTLNWIDNTWEIRCAGNLAGTLYPDNQIIGNKHGYIDATTRTLRSSDVSG